MSKSKKEIRPYVIFFKDMKVAPFRVFTSNDQIELWSPVEEDSDGLLTMRTMGQTVFCARHSDIFAIHDVKNELLHLKDWEKFRKEALPEEPEEEDDPKKPIYGADGQRAN